MECIPCMLEPLFELSRQMVDRLWRSYERALPLLRTDAGRCQLIVGQRGVGKTTMMVQRLVREFPDHISSRKCLYLPADHFLLAGLSLYEIAEAFANQGGSLLCIDEIHKSDSWARNLKSILDTFPSLRVIVTGSSLLHLERGSHDLSRRLVLLRVNGFSFREYLELRHGISLQSFRIPEIVKLHETLAGKISKQLNDHGLFVLGEFRRYLESGFYPYFTEFEDLALFQTTLQQSVRVTLESDLPSLHPNLTGATVSRVRRLLAAIAANVPFTPDLTKLRGLLHIADDRTLKDYLGFLADAGLILPLRRAGTGLRSMEKPDRIYLGDPNLACALAAPDRTDLGSLRETFFVRAVSNMHDVRAGGKADFLVDGRFTFEVGGKSKSAAQIKGTTEAWLALDDLPAGSGNRIPLWILGFIG
jgi:predicted AAA+ superfamily ATPase